MEKKKIKIPEPLKKYVIQDINKYFFKKEVIAKGGQASIWIAEDDKKLKYAIKEIQIDPDKAIRQIKRYLLECAALMRAQHQFIVSFRGMTDEYPFQIITDYVGSINLSKFLTDNHFKTQRNNGTHLTKIAMSISNAMMFLHKINIIHRDLKPSNVLIGNDYLPKICDFGLIHEISKEVLMTAELGTPIWMAPEVIRGEYYTEKCDVFSFAMILYQMATKILPLAELNSTLIMEKYKKELYRPTFPDNCKIPQPLKSLIISCWDENPNERPSFQQIFEKFATGEVFFLHCHSSTIKKFAKKLVEEDKKRITIPPFEVFTYKEEEDSKIKKTQEEKKSQSKQISDKPSTIQQQKKKKDEKSKKNSKKNDDDDDEESSGNNKKNKSNKQKTNNKKKMKKVEKSEQFYSEYSDDNDDDESNGNYKKNKPNKQKINNKKKLKKVEKSDQSYSEYSDDVDDDYTKPIKKVKKKPNRNQKYNQNYSESSEYSEYENKTKRKIKQKKAKKSHKITESSDSYSIESFHLRTLKKSNRFYDDRKPFKKNRYNDKFYDDKNELIFDVDDFVTENRKKINSKSSIIQYHSIPNNKRKKVEDDRDSDSIQKLPRTPHYKSHLTTAKKRLPAPQLSFTESSSNFYSESTIEEGKKDMKKFYPIDSPRCTTGGTISIETLNDVTSPLFRIELEKVTKKNFSKFLKILKNHLTSNIPQKQLLLLLTKTNELLEDDECLSLFSEKKIFEFLPISNNNRSGKNIKLIEKDLDSEDSIENLNELSKSDEIVDVSVTMLNKVCHFYPNFIDEDFETSMLSLINVRPIEAAKFLKEYSLSFETIENPWPLLDMLIVHKKKFIKSEAGSIVIKTIVYLIQHFQNYRKNRLGNCRGVITFYLNSSVKKNVISAYKALCVLYDDKFDLPFKKIRIDMEDNDLVNSVISLFEKMRKIPPVKSIIFSLLKNARKNEKAGEVLIKMAADYNSASILIDSQNEWMSNRLPYFDSTLRIFYAATSNFRDLQKIVISDSSFISDLFVRASKSDEKNESFVMIEKIMRKIEFDSEFIEKLKQKRFFTYFFRVFDEIEEGDNDVILSCLRTFQSFIEIGNCEEYGMFLKKLRKLSGSDQRKIASEAQYCIDLMKSPKRKNENRRKYS